MLIINNRKADFTNDKFSQQLVTQPNQAFTPRQILEQFARNEVIPSYNQSTDMIDDEHFSEEEMENIIEFEDQFEAAQHLIDNQYKLKENEKEQSGIPAAAGHQESSKETPETDS